MDRETKIVNEICPMCEHMASRQDITRDHQGQHIGFCSEQCAQKWDAMDLESKGERLAEVGSLE